MSGRKVIDLDAIEARTLAAYEDSLEQEQRDDILTLLRIARAADAYVFGWDADAEPKLIESLLT